MPEDLPRLTRQAQQAWAAIDHSRELVAQANALTVRLAETLEYCQYCADNRVLYGLWGGVWMLDREKHPDPSRGSRSRSDLDAVPPSLAPA